MLYADDGYPGFEFKNRPALNALLEEINENKKSQFIAIEHIDRLSRQAAWHQGYLDEWILIKVPPIVTAEEWAQAQKHLKLNRKRSPRNTKQPDWLLTTMIRCAR